MLIHRDTLISDEVITEDFVCNISKCKGICCVEGDFGAPLEEEEINHIKADYKKIKPYMTEAGRHVVKEKGFYEQDPEHELVTTLVKGRECVFAKNENGTWQCAIEQAFQDGKTEFRKPLSCHLYPVRISKIGSLTALNYDRWAICGDACKLGSELKVRVYKFCKDSLIRKFGEEWYGELTEVANDYIEATEMTKE
ncbi:MAG: DUF3109 family protein [Bacteroidia bacterium]